MIPYCISCNDPDAVLVSSVVSDAASVASALAIALASSALGPPVLDLIRLPPLGRLGLDTYHLQQEVDPLSTVRERRV